MNNNLDYIKKVNKALFDSSNNALKTGVTSSIIQVSALLWLRTTTVHQYKYGNPMLNTMKILYNDGGLPRFYRGYF